MEALVPHREDAVFHDKEYHLQDHKNFLFILQADEEYSKASLARLPDELCCQLASFLPVSDVLSLVTVNRNFHYNFGGSSCLWRMLHSRDGGKDLVEASSGSNALDLISVNAAEMKRACLSRAYLTCLPSVRWRQLKRSVRRNVPSSRWGHDMCVLGPPSNRMLVLTGGFTGHNDIHLLPLNPKDGRDGKWFRVCPSDRPPSFFCGASLTAIDSSRAVRFGGLRGGLKTSEVYLLTLEEKGGDLKEMEASWQTISVHGRVPPGQAYHSATLIKNRYLLIIGGKKAVGCFLMEAVLDVKTWTWLPTSVSLPRPMPKPSERQGHSVVLDEERNRLVLFGGASGSNILGSGKDSSEVWELKIGEGWDTDFESSFPWKWSKIYSDANERDKIENEYGDEAHLSRKERLCLGRCHISGKVSTNTVLLAFGSGRPSTNGLLAYDLPTDSFHRPQVSGRLPTPRFMAAGAIFDGWLVVHGGYSVANLYGTLGDIAVLDLAPGLKRTFAALPTTTPRLQQANRVLKSVDCGIKSSVDGQSLLLLRRVLRSVLKAKARMSHKALLLVRKKR